MGNKPSHKPWWFRLVLPQRVIRQQWFKSLVLVPNLVFIYLASFYLFTIRMLSGNVGGCRWHCKSWWLCINASEYHWRSDSFSTSSVWTLPFISSSSWSDWGFITLISLVSVAFISSIMSFLSVANLVSSIFSIEVISLSSDCWSNVPMVPIWSAGVLVRGGCLLKMTMGAPVQIWLEFLP